MLSLPPYGSYLGFYGGLLFCAIVAKVLRAESRTLSLLIAAVIVAPVEATPYIVGVLALVLRGVDVMRA